MVSLETGNKVTWEEEENWKFRLPKYKTELVSWASQSDGKLSLLLRSETEKLMDSYTPRYDAIVCDWEHGESG